MGKASSNQVARRGPRLGLFVANLLGAVVFGTIWATFNILLGNMVALRFLGWMNNLPSALSLAVSILPSTGQLLYEETSEAKSRAKKEAKRLGIEYEEDENELDRTALGIIAIMSTTIDVVGPALGIMVTVTVLGGEMAVVPAVVMACFASWACQRMAWRCFKNTLRMTWEAGGQITSRPFVTKTKTKRLGHSPAFQNLLESTQEER